MNSHYPPVVGQGNPNAYFWVMIDLIVSPSSSRSSILGTGILSSQMAETLALMENLRNDTSFF